MCLLIANRRKVINNYDILFYKKVLVKIKKGLFKYKMKNIKLKYIPGDSVCISGKVGVVESVEIYKEKEIQYKIIVDEKIYFCTEKDVNFFDN